MKILLIEDDEKIASFIERGLKEERMRVERVADGEEGLYMVQINHYDVVVVDWMLPGISGPEIVERIRRDGDTTPVLMLTARSEVEDRVEGLQSGADDYLGKPFAFSELAARLRALHRRNGYGGTNLLQTGDLVLDPLKREVRRGDQAIELGIKEFELLELLLRRKGHLVTHTTLLDSIWGTQECIESNVVNVTIYHLRNKIDKPFEEKLIETVRGSGYKIKDK
jgi:DNA-binding response OmpR family regulator